MADLHTLVMAFILGVVEGLTEFLPVSSTGHMIIVGSWFGFDDEKAKTFEVIIQLCSILAVVVMFWRRLFGLIGIHFGAVPHEGRGNDRLKLGHILLAAEWLKPKTPCASGLDDITYRQAFMIGCFQCLALWPGFSRSGATISGGMLMGVSRYAASEFSFILAVPMMMGATVLDLYKSWHFLSLADVPMFAVGFITVFLVALVAIKTFLKLIKRISFVPFAIYRFFVAGVVYLVFF